MWDSGLFAIGWSHLRRNLGVLLNTFSNLWEDFERASGWGVASPLVRGAGRGSADNLVEPYRKEVKVTFGETIFRCNRQLRLDGAKCQWARIMVTKAMTAKKFLVRFEDRHRLKHLQRIKYPLIHFSIWIWNHHLNNTNPVFSFMILKMKIPWEYCWYYQNLH